MISEIDILTRAFSKTRFALLEIHIFILQNAISLAVYINSMEKLTLHCMQPDKMVWATQSVVGINSSGGQYTATDFLAIRTNAFQPCQRQCLSETLLFL